MMKLTTESLRAQKFIHLPSYTKSSHIPEIMRKTALVAYKLIFSKIGKSYE